jgi:hypothetical protein
MLPARLDAKTPAYVPAMHIGGTHHKPTVKGDLSREGFLGLYKGSEEGSLSDMQRLRIQDQR